jgi:hypothetical protein
MRTATGRLIFAHSFSAFLCGYGGSVGVVLVLPIGVFMCCLQKRWCCFKINDGIVRVECQYISPKRCDFSPLHRHLVLVWYHVNDCFLSLGLLLVLLKFFFCEELVIRVLGGLPLVLLEFFLCEEFVYLLILRAVLVLLSYIFNKI